LLDDTLAPFSSLDLGSEIGAQPIAQTYQEQSVFFLMGGKSVQLPCHCGDKTTHSPQNMH
jgi:hypothetical protein